MMRATVLVVLAAALVTNVAAAAAVDPAALVVRPADIPAGFRLSRSESGVQTNEQATRMSPELGRLFRRWGRVSGYQVVFERGESSIEARVDTFRSSGGPREMLDWADRQVRLSGIRGIRRSDARIGEQSFLVVAGSPPVEMYVYWRQGVVWAALGGHGLTRTRTLSLARVQQRRILAALR